MDRRHPDAIVDPEREPYLLTHPGARVLLVGAGNQTEVETAVTGLATTLMVHAGVPAEHIRLMLNPPGPDEVERAVDGIAAEAADTLVVYYLGPARIGPSGDLQLLDSPVPCAELLAAARDNPDRTVVIILDCHVPFPAILSPGELPEPLSDKEFLLASGSAELGDALITLLRQGDPAAPRELSLRRVVEHVSRAVPSASRLPDAAGTDLLARNSVYPVVPPPRRRSALLAMVCAVVVLVAGAIWWAGPAGGPSSDTAASTKLAADAANLHATDPALAAQLAIAAYHAAPTEQAADQLYAALNTPLDGLVGDTGNAVLRVAAAADAPLVVASDQNRSARIWNVANPAAPVLDATIRAGGGGIAIAPHGNLLAGTCPTSADLCLWNLANPRHPTVLGTLPRRPGEAKGQAQITAMAISADSSLLAVAAEQDFTVLWSIADPARPTYLATLPNPSTDGATLAGVAIAPRGNLLAETILRGTTRLWNIADPAAPTQVASENTGYSSVAFSPDGSRLAAVGDFDVGLWNVTQPTALAPITVAPIAPNSDPIDLETVTFNAAGTSLAFGGIDTSFTSGELCTVDLQPTTVRADAPCVATGFAMSSSAAPASGGVLTGDYGGGVRLWRSALPEIDGVAAADQNSWTASRDGHLLAAPIAAPGGQPASSVGVWRLDAPGGPAQISTLPTSAYPLDFLGPTTLLLIDPNLGTVRLWNFADPHHPVADGTLGTVNYPPKASGWPLSTLVAADSAGNLVTVLDGTGTVHLWRVSAEGATEVGSIKPAQAVDGPVGLLADGHTAWLITPAGVDWWDVADPAHPVHRGRSPLSGVGSLTQTTNQLVVGGVPTTLGGQTTLTLYSPAGGGTPGASVVPGSIGGTPGGSEVPGSVGGLPALSPDGRMLAARGVGGDSIMRWDTADPRRPQPLAGVSTLPGIQGIDLDQSGSRMSDWNSSTLELWNDGTHAATISIQPEGAADKDTIYSATFVGPHGPVAVVTSGAIGLFDADPATLANRLCAYTGQSISSAQWQKYAPGVPYEKPCG